MTRVILVGPWEATSIGNGGNHRSYQVIHDLKAAYGDEHVLALSWYQWRQSQTDPQGSGPDVTHPYEPSPPIDRRRNSLIFRLISQAVRRAKHALSGLYPPDLKSRVLAYKQALRFYVDNPFRLRYRTIYGPNTFADRDFVETYKANVRRFQPDVCVIEHSSMSAILTVNEHYQIPTVAVMQNLEALDLAKLAPEKNRWHTRARLYDLGRELAVLERCQARAFISKVEAGFVQGLGYPAYYYPYRAVGEISERAYRLCEYRASHPVRSDLFLLIGSAHHQPIGEGLKWFIEQARQHGLPEGSRVVVVGQHTDKLLADGGEVPGLEFRGWLPQDELDKLLQTVAGACVPQLQGFGALTRLVELPCAGIPTIASRFTALAVEDNPNLIVVDNAWSQWTKAMREISAGAAQAVRTKVQPNHSAGVPLPEIIHSVLERRRGVV